MAATLLSCDGWVYTSACSRVIDCQPGRSKGQYASTCTDSSIGTLYNLSVRNAISSLKPETTKHNLKSCINNYGSLTLPSGRPTHIIHQSVPDSSKSTTRSFPQELQLHPPNITVIPSNLYQSHTFLPLKKPKHFHPIYSKFESPPPYNYTRLSPNLDLR